MAQGTANAVFWPMTILLITWVCASTVICLAFLSVAARPVPSMDVQLAPRSEAALAQERAVGLEDVRAASSRAETALPAACHAA